MAEELVMCTVTLELSDELAALAEKQGLLTPSALEAYIKGKYFGDITMRRHHADGALENAIDERRGKERAVYSKDAPGKPAVPLLDLRGSCKGIDTMDAYFERKRADKVLEDKADSLRNPKERS
jgi:hypothetical protein